MLWTKLVSKSITLADSWQENASIMCTVRCNDREINFALPAIPGLHYHFLPGSGVSSFDVMSRDAKVTGHGIAETVIRKIVAKIFYRSRRKVAFGEFIVAISGPRSIRRLFYRALPILLNSTGAIDGRFLMRPELFRGWSAETTCSTPAKVPLPGGMKGVIVCHLYYMELLEEVAALISSRVQHFDVVVTMPVTKEDWCGKIEQTIPGSRTVTFENMGRDVRPFLKLLEQGLLDDYDLICKIHGKKSKHDNRLSMLGDNWRRLMYLNLIGSQSALDETLHCFATEPEIGMIGPWALRCPGPVWDKKQGWAANRGRIIELAARMGISEDRFKLDFYAGTMFWVRRSALEPLRQLALADSYFEPERGLLDGGPEHAIERIFATSVIKAGYRLKDVSSVLEMQSQS